MWTYLRQLAPQSEHTDEDLLAAVDQTLWRDDVYRVLDRNSLRLEVHDGEVFLFGHVVTRAQSARLGALAEAVPGVRAVRNDLTADPDLVVEVAQALANDDQTASEFIGVGAHHGWIQLSGEVGSCAAQAAAEHVAASVARVRGVLSGPRVAGGGACRRPGRPLQPELGSAVYAADGTAGRVSQVMLSPHTRLVTHIAVSARLDLGRRVAQGEYLLPVEALTHANESGVFLEDTLAVLAARPAFWAEAYPLAAPDWQPPFPYVPASVRWPTELALPTGRPGLQAVDEQQDSRVLA